MAYAIAYNCSLCGRIRKIFTSASRFKISPQRQHPTRGILQKCGEVVARQTKYGMASATYGKI